MGVLPRIEFVPGRAPPVVSVGPQHIGPDRQPPSTLIGGVDLEGPGEGFGDSDPIGGSLLEGGERVKSGHVLQAGEVSLPGLCSFVPLVDDEHLVRDPAYP